MIKKFVYFLAIISVLFSACFWISEGKDQSIFYGDAFGYHSYLPATFTYNKLTTINEIANDTNLTPSVVNNIKGFSNAYTTNKDGQAIIQYTYGVAAMNSPGFFVVKLIDKVFNISPSTGYEMRYQLAVKLMNLLYVFLAFLLLYRFLIKYYKEELVISALLILLIGTNLFWFTFYQSGMSHTLLFFLNASLLYTTDKILETDCKLKYLIGFALSLAFIFLIRPTDIVVGIIPLLYNVTDKPSFLNRIEFIKKHFIKIFLICSLITLAIMFPQLYYWKLMTGKWYYYSYGTQSFAWSDPQIVKGLFSGRNGWFAYTPIMLLAVAGMFYKSKDRLSIALFILVPLYIYIIYSWWCWNYINGFGSRPMIHLYPFLAIPLINLFDQKKLWAKALLFILVSFGVMVNIVFTLKASDDKLRPDESKQSFNTSTFFKSNLSIEDLNVLDLNFRTDEEYCKQIGVNLITVNADSTKTGYDTIQPNEDYSRIIIEYFVKEEDLKKKYFRIGGTFRAPEHVHVVYKSCLLTSSIERNGKSENWYGVSINNKLGKGKNNNKNITISETIINEWDKVYYHLPTNDLRINDKLRIVIWNAGKNEMHVQNLFIDIL